MMKKYIGASIIAACLIVSACASDDADETAPSNNENTEDTEGTDNTEDNSENSNNNSGQETVTPNNSTDWGNSVMAIIAAQPDLEKFETAVLAAEGFLAETLNDPNNTWTVFAPSDDALGDVELDRQGVLKYISSGALRTPDLTGLVGSDLPMTDSSSHAISVAENGVTIVLGGATIFQNDITGDNGVVHKIDALLP